MVPRSPRTHASPVAPVRDSRVQTNETLVRGFYNI